MKNESNFHATALARFDDAYESQKIMRSLCVEASRFCRVPGAQYTGLTVAGYDPAPMAAARPRYEVNKVATEVNRIISEFRNNRITVKFRPGTSSASDELAEKLNGKFRADLQADDGEDGVDNAFDDGVTSGFGCVRIITQEEEDEESDDSDQPAPKRLLVKPVFDAPRAVWFDPDAREYNKSDGAFAFYLYGMSPAKYKRLYKKDPSSFEQPQQVGFHWTTPDSVYLAKYYERKRENTKIQTWQNPLTKHKEIYDETEIAAVEDELKSSGYTLLSEKSVKRWRVYVSILDGDGVLEEPVLLPFTKIPLIPFYGKRWFVDDIERVEGHVQKSMDPQRLYNMTISQLADGAANGGDSTPLVDAEQIRGYEHYWEGRNVKRPAFLPLKPLRDKAGQLIAPASLLGILQPTQISPNITALLQVAGADIAQTAGAQEAAQQMPSSLSNATVNDIFGRADMQSFIYLDNAAKSTRYLGEVWLGAARVVYGSDRQVRIVKPDGSDDLVSLTAEIKDEDSGQLIALNDLSVGKYDVTVDAGPSYKTARQAAVVNLIELLSKTPQNSPYYGPLFASIVENISGEGLDELKEFNHQQMLLNGLVKPKTPQEEQQVQQAQQSQAQAQKSSPEAVTARSNMMLAISQMMKSQSDQVKARTGVMSAQSDMQLQAAQTAKALSETKSTDIDNLMKVINSLLAGESDLMAQQVEQTEQLIPQNLITQEFPQ